MTKKEIAAKSRGITGSNSVQIVEYANKLITLGLVSPTDRKKYFHAMQALRDLSDQYCEIHGLELV